MIAPRWRKVLRDLRGRPGRSLLAAVAMAAGVFEITALLYKFAILHPVLTTMYERTRPSSATLVTDRVTDALIDSVRRVPGVADAEARPVVTARVRVGPDEWMPAVLYVVRDYDGQRMDRFRRERGAWPPGPGDVLLERSVERLTPIAIGEPMVVRTVGGDERPLTVAGTVHAPGLAPAWMEHVVQGFVGWNSVVRGAGATGGGGESAEIRVRARHPLDEGAIRETADAVKAMLETQGHSVVRTLVPRPGRHPHADQMDTFLFLLAAFGVLSFVLSAVLVASMVHGLMAEQLREIGIMKALGATSGQVAGLYRGQVSVLAIAALALGVPPGLWVGRAYAAFSAGILNADITRAPFPAWALAAEAVIAIAVPLLVALGPLRHASRITVREALHDDLGARWAATGRAGRGLAAIEWLPRPLRLSLRSALSRRARLSLTVATLAIAGASFMSALNVSDAWTRAVDRDFARRHYDLTLRLARPTPIDRVAAVLAGEPRVVGAEYWPEATPYLVGADGVAGEPVSLVGPDPGSGLLRMPMASGRWLSPADTGVAVVNQAVASRRPSLRVGGMVTLRSRGRTRTLPIVGVVKELVPMPIVYTAPAQVRALGGTAAGMARSVRVVTRDHDEAGQRAAARDVEQAFAAADIEVGGLLRLTEARQGILDHLVIVWSILTLAALVIVFVGALALTSMLLLSVVQRTREFGILGAIGATPTTIARHVWVEGVLVALLSWGLANVVALPITWALEVVCGRIFFRAPLDFSVSAPASAIGLALALLLASVSSFYPAWRAARLPVREALAHA